MAECINVPEEGLDTTLRMIDIVLDDIEINLVELELEAVLLLSDVQAIS